MTGDDDTTVLEPELEERLRRGLALLAERTPAPRSRRPSRALAAAAAAVVLAVAGIVVGGALAGHHGEPSARQAGPTPSLSSASPTSGGPIGLGVPYDLTRLVHESPRIVIGTVVRVTHGQASDASGGLPYVLADISIERTLRGPDGSTVVAFDYDYGTSVNAGAVHGATFTAGERMLLFLSSVAGTVHAALPPPHWQVTGGAAGAFRMRGEEPAATFTLEQVEQQLHS